MSVIRKYPKHCEEEPHKTPKVTRRIWRGMCITQILLGPAFWIMYMDIVEVYLLKVYECHVFWNWNGLHFLTPMYKNIFFAQIPINTLFSHLHKAGFLMMNLLTKHRAYERIDKFREQFMNRSTFCEIKYMNRLGFFSKAGHMIGVGFKIQTCTPIPKLPFVCPPPPQV